VNADLSVAPEIAQLAAPFVLPPQARVAHPRTVGRVAGELTRLAAAPQCWWDLVRFDPDGPARVLAHGTRAPHTVRGAGHGYSVSLHAGREGGVGKSSYPERTVVPPSRRTRDHPRDVPGNHHFGRRGNTRDPAH